MVFETVSPLTRPAAAHGSHLGDVGRVGVESALEVIRGRRVHPRRPGPGDARRRPLALQVTSVRRPHVLHGGDHGPVVRLVHCVATFEVYGAIYSMAISQPNSIVVKVRVRGGSMPEESQFTLPVLGGNRVSRRSGSMPENGTPDSQLLYLGNRTTFNPSGTSRSPDTYVK